MKLGLVEVPQTEEDILCEAIYEDQKKFKDGEKRETTKKYAAKGFSSSVNSVTPSMVALCVGEVV